MSMKKAGETSPIALANLEPSRRSIIGRLLDEGPVAIRPAIVRLLKGNGNAAILLCQLLYWTYRTPNAQGWCYNNQKKLSEQTGLGERAQLTARRVLIKKGFLEEKLKGIPARLYMRLNLENLADQLVRSGAISDSAHVTKQVDAHAAGQAKPHVADQAPAHASQLYKEIKQETTQETRGEKGTNAPPFSVIEENGENENHSLAVQKTPQHDGSALERHYEVKTELANGSPRRPKDTEGEGANPGDPRAARQAHSHDVHFRDDEKGQIKRRLWQHRERWLRTSIHESERKKEYAALQRLIDEQGH